MSQLTNFFDPNQARGASANLQQTAVTDESRQARQDQMALSRDQMDQQEGQFQQTREDAAQSEEFKMQEFEKQRQFDRETQQINNQYETDRMKLDSDLRKDFALLNQGLEKDIIKTTDQLKEESAYRALKLESKYGLLKQEHSYKFYENVIRLMNERDADKAATTNFISNQVSKFVDEYAGMATTLTENTRAATSATLKNAIGADGKNLITRVLNGQMVTPVFGSPGMEYTGPKDPGKVIEELMSSSFVGMESLVEKGDVLKRNLPRMVTLMTKKTDDSISTEEESELNRMVNIENGLHGKVLFHMLEGLEAEVSDDKFSPNNIKALSQNLDLPDSNFDLKHVRTGISTLRTHTYDLKTTARTYLQGKMPSTPEDIASELQGLMIAGVNSVVQKGEGPEEINKKLLSMLDDITMPLPKRQQKEVIKLVMKYMDPIVLKLVKLNDPAVAEGAVEGLFEDLNIELGDFFDEYTPQKR